MDNSQFTVLYPVFVITKGNDVAMVELTQASADATTVALALFTDEDGAITFRDEHFPGWSLGAFPNEDSLARLLRSLRDKVLEVALDPYRATARTSTIQLSALLDQMH